MLVFAPLFGEANRCRRLLVDVMAALAEAGIGSWMPDLPGTCESLREIATIGWEDWRRAAACAAAHVRSEGGDLPFTLALRGGALLDDAAEARARWRLAPASGASLLRDLVRARLASDREAGRQASGAEMDAALAQRTVELAGYMLGPALTRGLRGAEPAGEARALALGEGVDALPGPPLWRRAEPGRSPELARAIAADVAAWIARCAAS